MEYMIWIKKTSEILRNPTSSKWSENFWSCLQVDSLGFEQQAKVWHCILRIYCFSTSPSAVSSAEGAVTLIISVRLYNYNVYIYTVQPVLSGHPRGFYGQYSAFEDCNILNDIIDMAISFNALYKNYKIAANYTCKMENSVHNPAA